MQEDSMETQEQNLSLSVNERNRRWENIRMLMALRNLDCLLIVAYEGNTYKGGIANLRYITNFRDGGCCIFPINNEPIAFIGNQNFYSPWNIYESTNTWMKEVRPMESKIKGSGIRGIIDKLKEMGLEKGKIGFVDHEKAQFSAPYKHYQAIRNALPNAEFSDQNGLLMELRMIKSNEEIKMLEQSGRLANMSIKAMLEATKGMTEAELFANMLKVQIVNGGEPHCFILLESNSVSETSHLLHGKKPPKLRKFQNGDNIITEFHAQFQGYLTAVEMTVKVGKPEREFSHIYDVAVEAFKKGSDKMRPGIPFNEAVMAFRKPVKEAGMEYLELGVHGHGLSSGEFPTALYPSERTKYLLINQPEDANKLAPVSSFPLQENMVFGVNIDIHNPQWKKNIGVMLGDTIVVKQAGPQLLCQTPLQLNVI